MVLLPPDSDPRRRDRARDQEAARQQRLRFARDVGDEHAQAWGHETRRRRSKFTVGSAAVLIGFAVLGAVPVLLRSGDGKLLQPDCTRPAVEIGPTRVSAGGDFAWQVAGPETGPYVVTLDAGRVTGGATGGVTVDTGRVLAGPTALTGCRSAQTLADGPTATGSHEVALFRRSGAGWERVAVAVLRVS